MDDEECTDTVLNQVDIDRLAHLWDMIHQTNTLCDVLRTLSTSLKYDAMDISTRSLTMLRERIQKKCIAEKTKTHEGLHA